MVQTCNIFLFLIFTGNKTDSSIDNKECGSNRVYFQNLISHEKLKMTSELSKLITWINPRFCCLAINVDARNPVIKTYLFFNSIPIRLILHQNRFVASGQHIFFERWLARSRVSLGEGLSRKTIRRLLCDWTGWLCRLASVINLFNSGLPVELL